MTGPRFLAVPRDALLGELRAIGDAVRAKGGGYEQGRQGREVVVDIVPPGARCMVRVFTSLAVGADEVRACGDDAVRIVVCVHTPEGTRALERPIKVLRTAPRGVADADRVTAFLARLRDRTRDAYRLTVRRPSCPLCGRAMAKRVAKSGTAAGRMFLGCIGYPDCRGSMPVE